MLVNLEAATAALNLLLNGHKLYTPSGVTHHGWPRRLITTVFLPPFSLKIFFFYTVYSDHSFPFPQLLLPGIHPSTHLPHAFFLSLFRKQEKKPSEFLKENKKKCIHTHTHKSQKDKI